MTDSTGQNTDAAPAFGGTGPGQAESWRSEAVLALIREIIEDLAPTKDTLGRDTRLVEDLGFHSLALLELAFSLEDEFVLPTIGEETARAIRTVGDVEDHVLGALGTAGRLKA